jgi:glycosyltransferase involved in cell wall biosynthesis
MMQKPAIGIVVIGRNEGERLKQCLRSLPKGMPVVYVDSGSSDDSVAFARSLGVLAIELDLTIPFTAARARNVGWRRLVKDFPSIDAVQFVDGDCEVQPNWLVDAPTALFAGEKIAAVFGRRRERFPDASIYNRMCDDEWDVPVGTANSCGGDALFRATALIVVDGYSDDLIAGEEPDLCLRLRKQGWEILRVAEEMTLHDAAIKSWRAWWKRSKRAGFAYANHVWKHRAGADPTWVRQIISIFAWVSLLLGSIVACMLLIFWGVSEFYLIPIIFVFLAYGLQFQRMALRKRSAGNTVKFSFIYSAFILLGKLPEFLGMLMFLRARMLQKSQSIIEYKGAL